MKYDTIYAALAASRRLVGGICLCVLLSLVVPVNGAPDVIVSGLPGTSAYANVNGISAFAIGTVSCNIGDSNARWTSSSNQHPVIGQNLFRLKDGRFEHIGMSWVKHGFLVVSESNSDCGVCPTPGQATDVLRPGCADTYSSALNGDQSRMGPKSQVNAFTGYFPYPPIRPVFPNLINGRLQVHNEDIIPAMNEGARYFMEGHYILPDDASGGETALNNASYREVLVSGMDAQGRYVLNRTGPTVQQDPAIRAWRTIDPTVVETDMRVPGDPGEGLFILAAKATQLDSGFWEYEYALHNFNSDRSGGSFSVPVPQEGSPSEFGFHDVDYHSGEPYEGTDWTPTISNGILTWSTAPFNAQNDTSNALRWSTTYNFRFQSGAEPMTTTVTLGLFKQPGFPVEVTGSTLGPRLDLIDCNQNGLSDACDLDCGLVGGACDRPNCGLSMDCDENGIPDVCQVDCNHNLRPDSCDLSSGESLDCNENAVPDECEPDCDGDGITDDCDGSDADGDGFIDCDDLCPFTTPPDDCICPSLVECCCALNFCFDASPEDCIGIGCVPECFGSRCREGCLPGDGDGDGDQDLADVAALQNCFSGPRGGPTYVLPGEDCLRSFDEDQQNDIDLADFKKFHGVFVEGP
ncbi:MAG: thrombospondin type 3 repeat-containing protein [Planctomycetota bacterium]